MSSELQNGEEMQLEPELSQALGHFKASVHGWSNEVWSNEVWSRTMESRSRAVRPARRRVWRLAVACSLALLMAVGAASGLLYERRQQQVLATMQHEQLLQQQQQMTQQRQQAEEDLLAKVESDISREVPSAMEPLAQLMTTGGTETASANQ
ncbi:MAG TPA: hypothetical protein VFU55_05335 [Terracidiphilus sp.]|nr:hypothetical protein [Terracidiphilus sp.]